MDLDLSQRTTTSLKSAIPRTSHLSEGRRPLRPSMTKSAIFAWLSTRAPIIVWPTTRRSNQHMLTAAAFGFFNAYGNVARKDSVDYVIHLGDFIYEVIA